MHIILNTGMKYSFIDATDMKNNMLYSSYDISKVYFAHTIMLFVGIVRDVCAVNETPTKKKNKKTDWERRKQRMIEKDHIKIKSTDIYGNKCLLKN